MSSKPTTTAKDPQLTLVSWPLFYLYIKRCAVADHKKFLENISKGITHKVPNLLSQTIDNKTSKQKNHQTNHTQTTQNHPHQYL